MQPERTFAAMDRDDREVAEFARRHDLTEEQARRVLHEHGADESKWNETARSLIHFLRSPS